MRPKAMLPALALAAALLTLAAPAWAAPAWAAPADAPADGPLRLEITPPGLTIDAFYAGQRLTIAGETAQGQEVALEIAGPREDLSFDLRGQVGPFWMNRGRVEVGGVPSLYILLLPPSPPAEAELAALGLGMSHLGRNAQVSAPGQDPGGMFVRFLEFKQGQGLYQQKAGAVSYQPAGPGRVRFQAVCDLPAALSAGDYKVRAAVLQGGELRARAEAGYPVQDGAFLKLINGLAYERALLFGVLCVLVALVTGAVMGVVFKGGKGGH